MEKREVLVERVVRTAVQVKRNEEMIAKWKAFDLRSNYTPEWKSRVKRMRDKYRNLRDRRIVKHRRAANALDIPALV